MSVRKRSKPKKLPKGWVVQTNWPHIVLGRNNERIEVGANFIHGHPTTGVWIEDAGVEGRGQSGFKICGHPDYLDDMADALHAMAAELRLVWKDG
jgi:hypothetical protein